MEGTQFSREMTRRTNGFVAWMEGERFFGNVEIPAEDEARNPAITAPPLCAAPSGGFVQRIDFTGQGVFLIARMGAAIAAEARFIPYLRAQGHTGNFRKDWRDCAAKRNIF